MYRLLQYILISRCFNILYLRFVFYQFDILPICTYIYNYLIHRWLVYLKIMHFRLTISWHAVKISPFVVIEICYDYLTYQFLSIIYKQRNWKQ